MASKMPGPSCGRPFASAMRLASASSSRPFGADWYSSFVLSRPGRVDVSSPAFVSRLRTNWTLLPYPPGSAAVARRGRRCRRRSRRRADPRRAARRALAHVWDPGLGWSKQVDRLVERVLCDGRRSGVELDTEVGGRTGPGSARVRRSRSHCARAPRRRSPGRCVRPSRARRPPSRR